jgi:hypothetical protein
MPRQIPVGKGKCAVVDDDDYEELARFAWHVKEDNGRFYAARSVKVGKSCKTVRMHRQILGVAAGVLVDHRDGDGLNNTRGNLRAANHQQNAHNRKGMTGSRSGLKGAFLDGNQWKSQIRVAGKMIPLGRYATAEEAAQAYAAAAVRYHGEFARV